MRKYSAKIKAFEEITGLKVLEVTKEYLTKKSKSGYFDTSQVKSICPKGHIETKQAKSFKLTGCSICKANIPKPKHLQL